MGISVEEAIHELRNREEVFVAYSQATKLPYVTCDDETFNDQVRIFATEEEIKEYGKQLLEDKILLMGMKYEKKDFPRLYGTLYAIGVNSVIWIDGEEQIEIEIGKIAKQRDMSKIEPAKRPLLNPSLELSGIYFMQELRRPVKQEEHKNIRELEEELIANLRKAEFLIAINAEQEEDGKLHIPYLKNKEDKILQPVFTDVMEFEKFGRGKNLRVAKVTMDKLPSLMIPQANAYVINPLGFNLILNKEQVEKLQGSANKNKKLQQAARMKLGSLLLL